ncbi:MULTISPECIES: disulfide bond formation protein B [unclassified Pseudomonas]|uniref:disulfide bond formation protein B n=1 Tax=unclassified Pseudomonas TaxID=196821 RepID=UPI000A1DE5F5|nr:MULTISPECIES: disulfide bond formation protein B [unclassified Pseudomonas]
MSLTCSRSLFFMAFMAGALALGASYYLEYTVGLTPCHLCLVQRLFLVALFVCCGVAAVHGPRRVGLSLYWMSALAASAGGMTAAWRQVLWQSDPLHQLANCIPAPETPLSWMCALSGMFNDHGDCAEISWTLFDLSIPEWSLLFFLGMSILAVYQLLRLLWGAVQRPFGGEASHRLLIRD